MQSSLKAYFTRGFTIVEISVVIVIIAILAAITLTVYSSVTDRANNDQTIAAVTQYVKALKTYAADNGGNGFPVDIKYPCLGAPATKCGITPASPGCWGVGYVAGEVPNTGSSPLNLSGAVLSEITSLPQPSPQLIQCNGASYASGAFYYASATTTAYIRYFLKGNVSCGSPAGATLSGQTFSVNTTYCSLTLLTT